jgi:DNA-binding IclR family transcriptional regulator
MAVTRPPGAYFVTRTVRALELLAFGPLSAPQLAEAMQVGVATARRMLWRLAEEEYVVQLDEPRRRYALTPRLVASPASGSSTASCRGWRRRSWRCCTPGRA